MSSHYIPCELLVEIFIRLPVESLARFTSACKLWYALITDPKFINLHANYTTSSHQDKTYLIRYFDINEEKYMFQLRNRTFLIRSNMVRLDNRISSERNYSNDFCIIFGSCRGLVCLESSGSISLWNPSIRKSLIISAKPLNYVLGFGVCNVTNDHKVVKLVYKQNISSRCMVQPEVEIYSLSTRSWRSVSDPAPSNHLVRDFWGYQCFVFGSVHWIASDVNREGDKYNLVVSFDMSKEVFNKLMFPNSIANYMHKLSITVLGDSLAALEFMNWKRGQRSYCVWVMKEYGVSESWTKLFTVKIPYWLGNVAFREDGRIILPLKNYKLVFCDPESYDIKDLDNADDFGTYGIFTYTESLVLLKGRSSIPEGMPNLFAASAAKCS